MLGKDRGKTGKVLMVWSKKDQVLVEGVNFYRRHVRKSGQQQGGIIDIAKPLSVSNLALVCPSCQKTTRVGFKIENGDKRRVCKKCGKDIK